jgi:glycosyltransferase involved in cell wall biosynthesis
LKIALVHDWLDSWGGAENVLVDLRRIFPDAPVYTLVDFLTAPERARLGPAPIRTSFIQRMPGARSNFRRYLPLFPTAIRSLDLDAFEVILSNSHAVAKLAPTHPGQLHICYCHTPMRYAWDQRDRYLAESGLAHGVAGFIARATLERMRRIDLAGNDSIQQFVGNSHYIAKRIRRCYHSDADVIYPPVDTGYFVPGRSSQDYFVTLSRLVPYKQVDVLVEAFVRMPDRRLIVAGGGPMLDELRAVAPPNVELRGHVDAVDLLPLLQNARAFLFAAEEDFGIAPLEAQACGVPVIALGHGGVAETVDGGDHARRTGVFFSEPTPAAIVDAVRRFDEGPPISREACRVNALRFSRSRFRDEFRAYIDSQWAAFRNKLQSAKPGHPHTA